MRRRIKCCVVARMHGCGDDGVDGDGYGAMIEFFVAKRREGE